MDASVHRATSVKVSRTEFKNFHVVTFYVTDEKGRKDSFEIFSDNKLKISIPRKEQDCKDQ